MEEREGKEVRVFYGSKSFAICRNVKSYEIFLGKFYLKQGKTKKLNVSSVKAVAMIYIKLDIELGTL